MIYTLGYEKRNIKQFVDLLKEVDVSMLIDVRETAWSHKADFCKNRFKSFLEKEGIEYVHVKELGNPKHPRNMDSKVDILDRYRKYLAETESGIFPLLVLLEEARKHKRKVCLTCFEKENIECHRSIITEHIKGYIKEKVIHL